MSAVESTRQGRTSTRQKPCFPRKETPALLRCTPASLAVRHTHTDIHTITQTSAYILTVLGVAFYFFLLPALSALCYFYNADPALCFCVCVAGDKKMMVPSSTAGGQQLYSQSSPFQQGHSGKSFRYMSIMIIKSVSAGKAQGVTSLTHFVWWRNEKPNWASYFNSFFFCTQFLCDPCPQREWHPAIRLIQSESCSDHQTAQPRPGGMVREPAPLLWTGNTSANENTHTQKGFVTEVKLLPSQCQTHLIYTFGSARLPSLVPVNRWTCVLFDMFYMCVSCLFFYLAERMCWAYVS